LKGYKALELTNKLSNKCWTKSSINRLLKKFRRHQRSQQTHKERQTTNYPHWRKCWRG